MSLFCYLYKIAAAEVKSCLSLKATKGKNGKSGEDRKSGAVIMSAGPYDNALPSTSI